MEMPPAKNNITYFARSLPADPKSVKPDTTAKTDPSSAAKAAGGLSGSKKEYHLTI